MTHKKMHDNEIDINIPLIKELLSSQFPQWENLSIEPIQSAGTDNAIYRLGKDMCIRLPRIPDAAKHIEKEATWLPRLASMLPLTIPIHLGKGRPQEPYPWCWEIYSWLEGENAFVKQMVNFDQAAIDLAEFLIALQKIDATDGPPTRRGKPLAAQDEATRTAIKSLYGSVDTKKITMLWEESLQAPVWNKPPVFIHGDLLPINLLVQNDRLSGIIDFDLFGTGDPACDLIPGWSMFCNKSREVFRKQLDVDDATWVRGRGWALSIAVIIIPYYQHSNPVLTAIAQRMLNEILTDF